MKQPKRDLLERLEGAAQACHAAMILSCEATCREAAQEIERLRKLKSVPTEELRTSPDGLWVVWYEDPAKQHDVFFGAGAEDAARAKYKSAYDHWSCHLLSRIPHPAAILSPLERTPE